MSWAARRRFVILLIIGAAIAAVLALASFATFYEAPSCVDNTQNQDEAGIDCGGPCPYLCTADQQPPTVLFTKAFQNVPGRTDVIAEVENKNAAAAKGVPYRLTLYGTGQSLIQQVMGTVDLPPGAKVPVYVPGITSGKQTVTSAFLQIDADAPRWFLLPNDPRVLPAVSNTTLGVSTSSPRIDAVLTNQSVAALTNVRVIVFVHGVTGEVIAASQTIIPAIPPQGYATATFTWNNAFSSAPATIEVVPIIPLP